jgi:hypothetical protein
MDFLPRSEKTLAVFKMQPAILRNPNSTKEARVDAFYCLLTMEWKTNGAITMLDLAVIMTAEQLENLALQHNHEFMEAKNRLFNTVQKEILRKK